MNTGTPPHPYRDPASCTHGVTFPSEDEFEEATKGMTVPEIAARWPRLCGLCPLGCGYNGIFYASYLHYVMGDW